jgi:predicted hotdog family 3-hydroxylacyl-ACP dehydratase
MTHTETADVGRGQLPHGPGMRLVCGDGREGDGWFSYPVRLDLTMSVVSAVEGDAPPELGLEMMAQACGVFAAQRTQSDGIIPRGGVVGAVRNYEYEARRFVVGEQIVVRIRPDLVEAHLVVCDCELLRGADKEPSQRARVTIVMQGGE